MKLPEDNARPDGYGAKYGIIMSILLIIAIISIAFAVYLKSQNVDLRQVNFSELASNIFHANNQGGKITVISQFKYDPEENPAFAVHDNYIIKCSPDSIKWLDEHGDEQKSEPVSFSKPLVKSAGPYLVAADIGGRDIYIITGNEIKWNEKLDSKIINADINSKGYASVVKEMKGYKGNASVYDRYGNWVFTAARSEAYILSAKVSPSGSKVLLNTVDYTGVSANSKLDLLDMGGKTLESITVENVILPSIWYLNGGLMAAVSESSIICMDENQGEKWKQEFDRIFSSIPCSGKYLAAAVSDGSKAGVFGSTTAFVKLFDISGKAKDVYTTNSSVVNLESYENIIAVNTGKEVHFINTSGRLIAMYNPEMDIEEVRFFDRGKAAVITKNSVQVVKFN